MIELAGEAGQRLDQWLARQLPQYSRSRLQDWIKLGLVRIDGGAAAKASLVLRGGERIEISPAPLPELKGASPEEIPLDILYEDDWLVAVNKPAGMTVHAGAGRHEGTLANALLGRYATLSSVNGDTRPGIVHRLDRQTSGVLLVARTDAAHRALAAQFAGRVVEKTYLALVEGLPDAASGRIEKPIGRHHLNRLKMAVSDRGRYAVSDWRVLQRGARHALLEVKIGTGRTHQIRVHLASIRHPVAGDRLYGAHGAPVDDRFFLHAQRIRFQHPEDGRLMDLEAPLPSDLEAWLRSVL